MGRLHYTNRKIEGLKLGQVVNKDLFKRIPPHAGSKAAFRDPTIDLDISGKALTDEGFSEVASALVEALKYHGTQGRCTRLEELCLKDNELSLPSLQALTPIIKLACHDLKDLDLSGNLIHIHTHDEVAIWEEFLTSFEECCTLRRIDLSRNALGPRAFEALLRVYAKERPVDLILPPELQRRQDELHSPSPDHIDLRLRKMSLISEPGECRCGIGNGSTHHSKSPEDSGVISVQADSQSTFAAVRGLRSVPYLVLCDTAMTDTCALHLSFIVESHHTPAQLLSRVPPAKAGSSAQQIMAYDQSQCRGIIYQSNAPLSNAGLKVLELAERSRDQQYHDSTEADSGPLSMPSESSRSPRRGSGAHSIPNITTTAKRRRSTQIGVLEQGGIGPDLDRARSRIEGNTLQDAGPSSNDLWSAALRLLVLSREVPPQSSKKLPAPSFATGATKAKAPIIKTLTIPGVSKPKTLKPLTPLIVEKDPNQPSNPWNTGFRKKSDSIPPTPKVIPPTPLTPKTEIEKNRPPRIEKIYRTRLPCGFSEHAWAKILGYTVDAESILSFDQQLSILHYAIDRSTLSREREALGLTVATQIWRILEATGCLTYEMDI